MAQGDKKRKRSETVDTSLMTDAEYYADMLFTHTGQSEPLGQSMQAFIRRLEHDALLKQELRLFVDLSNMLKAYSSLQGRVLITRLI